MRLRIVIADRARASFYDTEHLDAALHLAGQMTDPKALLRDRDYASDRPGRVFDHAPGVGRRGAVARHDTAGERSPRKHEAGSFARRIVAELERTRRLGCFDQLVFMAPPEFLGMLRKCLPKSLRDLTTLEIGKDMVHQDERAIRDHLPAEVFAQPLQ